MGNGFKIPVTSGWNPVSKRYLKGKGSLKEFALKANNINKCLLIYRHLLKNDI